MLTLELCSIKLLLRQTQCVITGDVTVLSRIYELVLKVRWLLIFPRGKHMKTLKYMIIGLI